jgi:phosphinothricin acetyltransferase
MAPEDWPAIEAIYLEGIATGTATLETDSPGWEIWDQRHCPRPRLVAHGTDEIIGFAALSPVSARNVYRGVSEVSLYVASRWREQGVGRALLDELIRHSEAEGIWTLQAGILAENAASLRLFGKAGFRTVGRRERIGQLHGIWRDVILLERRSAVAGR